MSFYRSKPKNNGGGGGGNPDLSYTVCYTQGAGYIPLKSSVSRAYIGNNTFNSPVIIGNNVNNCFAMFSGCSNFNQSVIIPNGVVDCSDMFSECQKWNQPLVIPNTVKNCSYMFYLSGFNQSLIIPKSVTDVRAMFMSCIFGNQNFYINGTPDVTNMFDMMYGQNRINVFCNRSLNVLNICGATMIPMSDGNGYYNVSSYYNLYVYNNYTGT